MLPRHTADQAIWSLFHMSVIACAAYLLSRIGVRIETVFWLLLVATLYLGLAIIAALRKIAQLLEAAPKH